MVKYAIGLIQQNALPESHAATLSGTASYPDKQVVQRGTRVTTSHELSGR